MRFFTIFILTLVVFSISPAEIIKTGSFQASSDGVNVTLRWITADETNVARFEIERRQGTEGEYVLLGSMNPKGPSRYEFIDYSAFQKFTAIYQYRIKIVFLNGTNPMYIGPVTVSHMVNGVRRTWGSIKAMFR